MRFVATKTAKQQGALTRHKVRDLLVRQRTMIINALRGHLAEFGIVGGDGAKNVRKLIDQYREVEEALPDAARGMLAMLVDQLDTLEARIAKVDEKILASVKLRCSPEPGQGRKLR